MTSRLLIYISILFSIFLANESFGQEKKYNGDPDISFKNARDLANNNNRKQAQDTLLFVLSEYPDYHEVRSYLATTYSWDGEYKRAEKEFEYVLDKEKKNKEIWIAAIKNQIWANFPIKALDLISLALIEFPNDSELLLLKATAEQNNNKLYDASNTIEDVLKQDANNKEAITFKSNLNAKMFKNMTGVIASVDLHSIDIKPIQYYSLRYARFSKYGSFFAKVNLNHNFNQNGIQYELEAYPKITKDLYAYANIAYSDSPLFPEFKYGAELFKTINKKFEASLGIRTLQYSKITNFYTGSFSWYNGNNLWSFRTYVTPKDEGTSLSGVFIYRKYRKDADNYFGAVIGFGYSPEVNQLNFNNPVIFNVKSQKLNLNYYFTSSNNKHAFGTQLGVTHQEKVQTPGEYYLVYFIAFSWDLRFK